MATQKQGGQDVAIRAMSNPDTGMDIVQLSVGRRLNHQHFTMQFNPSGTITVSQTAMRVADGQPKADVVPMTKDPIKVAGFKTGVKEVETILADSDLSPAQITAARDQAVGDFAKKLASGPEAPPMLDAPIDLSRYLDDTVTLLNRSKRRASGPRQLPATQRVVNAAPVQLTGAEQILPMLDQWAKDTLGQQPAASRGAGPAPRSPGNGP